MTQWGIFSDEGMVAGPYDSAVHAEDDRKYMIHSGEIDPDVDVTQICADHPGQQYDACEICAAEDRDAEAEAVVCNAERTGEGYWTCDVPGGCPGCRHLAMMIEDPAQFRAWDEELAALSHRRDAEGGGRVTHAEDDRKYVILRLRRDVHEDRDAGGAEQ